MDKNAIKKYAIWAREELIRRVSAKAEQYGVSSKDIIDVTSDSIHGKVLTSSEKAQRKTLIEKVNKQGYEQVMEEVAYTWFNRFTALRFMEVNNYLPSKIRVFTDEENNFNPQILAEAIHLEMEGLKQDIVFDLKEKNETEKLYKYLLITQCNALNSVLPQMFQKINDYSELLFPDNILREGSVIEQMIRFIPEEDFKEAVEIIGWLYQYYNTAPKDQVFANLKKNIKINKENIPAATQLFTPDWIVRYMVENSLGRIAVEKLNVNPIEQGWKYYLEEAEQTEEVQKQLAILNADKKDFKLENLKLIDPCMGSGHILVYAFDVLVQIYESQGYSARDAVALILEHNLYGLDIDDRAHQLAYFAIIMKARSYDRRFFTKHIVPQLYSPKNYEEGKEYGSLLLVDTLEDKPQKKKDNTQFSVFDEDYNDKINTWNFRRLLAQKYDVVVTNPPYMSNLPPKLMSFLKQYYPNEKNDLYAAFIRCCTELCIHYVSVIAPESWMFISAYRELRKTVFMQTHLISCIHLGTKAFDCGFGTAVLCFSKNSCLSYAGSYVRVVELEQEKKHTGVINKKNIYFSSFKRFQSLPNEVMAYWCTQGFVDKIKNKKPFSVSYQFNCGIKTGNNELFLRLWHEVSKNKINSTPTKEALCSNDYKWYYYNKGGGYKKWYGGYEHVINLENNAKEIKEKVNKSTYRLRNLDNYFVSGTIWPLIGEARFSGRYLPDNTLSDVTSNAIYFNEKYDYYPMSLMNSIVFNCLLNMINPTLGCPIDSVAKVPFIQNTNIRIEEITQQNISLSKKDWDSFETSWDFEKHPLI